MVARGALVTFARVGVKVVAVEKHYGGGVKPGSIDRSLRLGKHALASRLLSPPAFFGCRQHPAAGSDILSMASTHNTPVEANALSDPAALAVAAEQASDFLKSLANPVRLRILCLLAEGEASVGEITERLAARQSLISQHLALLRKDGLVRAQRDGQNIRYALADVRVERLIGVLYETFCPAPPRA